MNKTFRKGARTRRPAASPRMEALESRQLLATFLVTTNADSGAGSFRQAIVDDNATSSINTIDFAIPGTGVQTISLASPLPSVNNPAIIDATTQPGYAGSPLVELNGSNIYQPGVVPPTLLSGVNGLVLVGGASSVEGLTIDRFTGNGIDAMGDGNTIASDFIGTDPTGTRSSGNGFDGIFIQSRNNTIGGLTRAGRNLISGNTDDGIYLGTTGTLPGNNLVEGNLIGTDVTGTVDQGNGLAGVDVESSGNTIGGTSAPLGNTIQFNGAAGVQVGTYYYESGVNQNRILNNSIFSNVGLGIDLGNDGVTPISDVNYGPNHHQNFPSLTSAYSATGGGTTVEGSFFGSPNAAYAINYYLSPNGDPSGYGQGLTPISSQTIITDANGNADTTTTLTAAIPVGEVVTATATSSIGDTSEFSRALVVSSAAESLLVLSPPSIPSVVVNVPINYTFTVQNSGPSVATNVNFVDTLPKGAVFLYGTSSQGGTPSGSDGTVSANLGSLADGASATITVTYAVTTTGLAVNTAHVTADQKNPSPSDGTITQTTQVTPALPVDLSISGSATPDPVQVGADLTYTFLVTNYYYSNDASGVTVTDPLPQNVTFVSASSSQGAATEADGVVTANLGFLAASTNATVTVVVRPDGAGFLPNTATVKGNESDFDQYNNSATVQVDVTPAPSVDLAVSISAAPQPAQIGQNITYVVTVANNGSATATGVTLTNLLPGAASIVSVLSSQGTVSLAGSTLTASLGTLAPGTQAALTFVLKPGAPGVIVDQASVTSDQTDFNFADNSATNSTTITADTTGPTLMIQRLTVAHDVITGVVLTFDKDLDPALAADPLNYQIVDLGSKSSLTSNGPSVPFTVAYNPATRSAILTPKKGLAVGRFYKLVLNGPGAPGIEDLSGNVLDGVRNGLQNTAYVALIGRGTVTRPISIQIGAEVPHPYPTQGEVKSNQSKPSAAHVKSVHVKVAAAKPTHVAPKAKAHH